MASAFDGSGPPCSGVEEIRPAQFAFVDHAQAVFGAAEIGGAGVVGAEGEFATGLARHLHELDSGEFVAIVQLNRNLVLARRLDYAAHAVLGPEAVVILL